MGGFRRIRLICPWGMGVSGGVRFPSPRGTEPRCCPCRGGARSLPRPREISPRPGRGRCGAPPPFWGLTPSPLFSIPVPHRRRSRLRSRARPAPPPRFGRCGCEQRDESCVFETNQPRSLPPVSGAGLLVPTSPCALQLWGCCQVAPCFQPSPPSPTPGQLVRFRQEGDTAWLGCWWHRPGGDRRPPQPGMLCTVRLPSVESVVQGRRGVNNWKTCW